MVLQYLRLCCRDFIKEFFRANLRIQFFYMYLKVHMKVLVSNCWRFLISIKRLFNCSHCCIITALTIITLFVFNLNCKLFCESQKIFVTESSGDIAQMKKKIVQIYSMQKFLSGRYYRRATVIPCMIWMQYDIHKILQTFLILFENGCHCLNSCTLNFALLGVRKF